MAYEDNVSWSLTELTCEHSLSLLISSLGYLNILIHRTRGTQLTKSRYGAWTVFVLSNKWSHHFREGWILYQLPINGMSLILLNTCLWELSTTHFVDTNVDKDRYHVLYYDGETYWLYQSHTTMWCKDWYWSGVGLGLLISHAVNRELCPTKDNDGKNRKV